MRMMDISGKEVTEREAVVAGSLRLKAGLIRMIRAKKIPKGDVLQAAEIAGILAAKRTPETIPLCHPVPIDSVRIEFALKQKEIGIKTTVKGFAKTGLEMEAFFATAVAALTIYDMCKAFDRAMVISGIRLLKKTGGKSGTYIRK